MCVEKNEEKPLKENWISFWKIIRGKWNRPNLDQARDYRQVIVQKKHKKRWQSTSTAN